MLDILKTQKLDVTFVVRYILNTNYQFDDKDKAITYSLVLKCQPHISSDDLEKELFLYDSDDDSIEDFETCSNRN